MIRGVYKDGKQYANVAELMSDVSNAWCNIFDNFCRNLAKSMPIKYVVVLQQFGGKNSH